LQRYTQFVINLATDGNRFEDLLRLRMKSAYIPGASLAFVRNGRVERVVALGVRDSADKCPVNVDTVFDAASLSKPMVAYAVLQLVDAGELNLDESLAHFAPPIVPGDQNSALITARHVLAHNSGLPNVQGSEPTRFHFKPSTRFSYCSLGFNYLQKAVECITEEPFEVTMQRLVFAPLAMNNSSFEWQGRFRLNFAAPHESGKRLRKGLPGTQASYSLQTTAADYAAFLVAVLNGERLQETTREQWFTPHARVPEGVAVHLDDSAVVVNPELAWRLGWGLEVNGQTFFQWGKIEGVRSFVMGNITAQSAVVMLTNSNTGLRLIPEITDFVLPGAHPALRWLEAVVSE
jgi:CubicO group peptidase (beta-lactamase class C family)